MFWNKKLTDENANLKTRLDRLDKQLGSVLAENHSLSLQCETFASDANKLRDEKQEIEKHSRSLETLIASTSAKLQQQTEALNARELSLDRFNDVVSEIHSLAVCYQPITVDGLKNNSSLKNKLKEAQSLIIRIFEKSKGNE